MNDHNINIENEQWVNNLLNNNSKYLPEDKKHLYKMKLRLGHTIIIVTIVWCNCS